MPLRDDIGAFCEHGLAEIETRPDGVLAGLAFAVKDLFDVAGLPTGAGSPQWLEDHAPPRATASAVLRLLDAGARFVGKTRTDELAWSLSGQNAHYGTPINVAAPGRIPGGSSSGSAAATAAGLVDFALGSDTGGSVRLPASFCGLYGIRPTFGRIPIDGAVPLAASYDTVGWFAREASTFSRVGRVLLPDAKSLPRPSRLVIAQDLFRACDDAVRAALAGGIERIEDLLGPAEAIDLALGTSEAWRDAFRTIQAAEAWDSHGAWITRIRPAFGPGVAERFAAAERQPADRVADARRLRAAIRDRLDRVVPPGTVMILPSAPCAAPRCDASEAEMERMRADALTLLCPAGHAGLPQASFPLGSIEGCPIGLSLVAPRGEDEVLLDLALALGSGTPPT